MKRILFLITTVIISFNCSRSSPEPSERFIKKFFNFSKKTIVISEGEFEPRSIGSYSIKIYDIGDPKYPTDFFEEGIIRPRDGSIEKVIFKDLDNDNNAEIIIKIRSVGTGSYLSADAFSYKHGKLKIFNSVNDLDKNSDVIEKLEKK